jgi:hypothetical protein
MHALSLNFPGLAMSRRDEYVEVFEPRREPAKPAPDSRYVDVASVPPSQWAMHDRLENWARWCRGSQKQTGTTGSPMFSLYRSSDAKRTYGEETSVPIDKDDALKIHFAITGPTFDPQMRRALQWCYLRPKNPAGQARELGLAGVEQLRDLIRDGRQLLIDSKA